MDFETTILALVLLASVLLFGIKMFVLGFGLYLQAGQRPTNKKAGRLLPACVASKRPGRLCLVSCPTWIRTVRRANDGARRCNLHLTAAKERETDRP
jgi:hypothetical protein